MENIVSFFQTRPLDILELSGNRASYVWYMYIAYCMYDANAEKHRIHIMSMEIKTHILLSLFNLSSSGVFLLLAISILFLTLGVYWAIMNGKNNSGHLRCSTVIHCIFIGLCGRLLHWSSVYIFAYMGLFVYMFLFHFCMNIHICRCSNTFMQAPFFNFMRVRNDDNQMSPD